MADEDDQQIGPQLRSNGKRRRWASPESDKNDLTASQTAHLETILDRLKKINPEAHIRSKMARREISEGLMAEVNEQLCCPTDVPKDFIKNTLEKANDIYSKTELNIDNNEMKRDSVLLSRLSDLLIQQSSRLLSSNVKNVFSVDSFVAKLNKYSVDLKSNFLRKDDDSKTLALQLVEGIDYEAPKKAATAEEFCQENWAVLQRDVDANIIIHEFDMISPLCDHEDEDEERAPTDKREKKPRATKEVKEEVVVIRQKEEEKESETDPTVSRQIEHLRACLRRAFDKNGGKVNYFRFIINPDSFSRSIENMFHTSFLIRDCYARIDLHETDGLLYLYDLDADDRVSLQRTGAETAQHIMLFDMRLWRGFTRALNINETMIPPLTP